VRNLLARGRCGLAIIFRAQRAVVSRQHRNVTAEQTDRLPPELQFSHPCAALFGLLRRFDNPRTPGLGKGAGPRDEPAEGQGCLGRVAEALGDHGCP